MSQASAIVWSSKYELTGCFLKLKEKSLDISFSIEKSRRCFFLFPFLYSFFTWWQLFLFSHFCAFADLILCVCVVLSGFIFCHCFRRFVVLLLMSGDALGFFLVGLCLGVFVWVFFNVLSLFLPNCCFYFISNQSNKAWPSIFVLSKYGVGGSISMTGNHYPQVSHMLRAETFLYFLASEQVGITISIALCEEEYVFSFHYHSFLFCWWSKLARRMFFIWR